MPTDPSEHNGSSRLDRIEAGLERLEAGHEKFQYEHNQLLRAQVLLTDHVEKVTGRVDRLTDRVEDWSAEWNRGMAELREQQKHTDERLNALIAMMDDWIRRQPPPQPN